MSAQTQIFSNNQRGELQELYQDLNDLNFEKKKDAIKRVIAYMTVGKDVSGLFQSVIKCLEFNDIELKKLIYLYIINYSRQKPDDAIMVIQLFRKDVRKTENPLVRALAVRTFGCLRVPKLNDYLIEPLKECLADDDPYVRKTAVLCVPKVYEVSPELIQSNGIIDIMEKLLLKESNSLVIANLVCALKEISDLTGQNHLRFNPGTMQKVLLAANECIEWGQIFILDCLGYYTPKDSNEAEIIIERILPRLAHINPTVVFSAVKVILKYLDYLDNGELVKNLCKKLAPSLVSLITWNQFEIQYIILRNTSLILQKYPVLFEKDVKVFFCSFNEPYYVKYEKLDIMVKICDNKNYPQVLNELGIYINEADPEFVRRTVKALGKIGLRYDKSVEKVLQILVEFASNTIQAQRGDVAVQELLVQIQNLYRKYRHLYSFENSLVVFVSLVEFANEPDAKAAAAWVLGEFGEYIKNATERLQQQIDQFGQEERQVQLQILTASVKLFLKFPNEHEQFLTVLLNRATESFNPDVRDRAYIYWRLLSIDPEKTKKLVCNQVLSNLGQEKNLWETQELEIFVENLGSLSNTMHKLPSQLPFKTKPISLSSTDTPMIKKKVEQTEQVKPKEVINIEPEKQSQQPQQQPKQVQPVDLLGFEMEPQVKSSQQQQKIPQAESFDLI